MKVQNKRLPGQNLEGALLQGTYMLMKHYDLSQHPDAELKFGAPGLEDLELEEAPCVFSH